MPGYGFGFSPALSHIWTNLNSLPDWALNSYFSIPPNEVTILAGQSTTIYGEELIVLPVPVPVNFTVTYTCAIGTQSGNNFTFNPTNANAGTYPLTILFKLGALVIDTHTINIRVQVAVTSTAKKILMVGDSTMNELFASNIVAKIPNTTFTFLGTQGDTYKHEGYGGASWYTFITDGSTPAGKFVKAGVLNIPAYFTDNSIDVPDIVFIRLGINDTFSASAIAGDGLTYAEQMVIINRAKTLIDAFLAYNASLKIIIAIPTICEDSGAGWNANYDEAIYSQTKFVDNMLKYQNTLIAEFSNNGYNARVSCSYDSIFLDRNDGYPKTDGIHNNGVHPSDVGYNQIGGAMAATINDTILGVEKVNPLWATAAGWTDFGSNWSGDGVRLTSNGSNGACDRVNFWTIGKTYQITVRVTRVSGTFYGPYDGATFSSTITASGTYVFYYTPTAVFMFLYSGAFNGTVDFISIMEV